MTPTSPSSGAAPDNGGNSTWLADQFLIAMPSLKDPNFYHTVTYICEHNANGAMGIVINQPLEVNFGDVLDEMDMSTEDPEVLEQTVFMGGPVQQDRGFVLHQPLSEWDSTLKTGDDTGLTASRDIIAAIAEGRGPDRTLVALGYAGWGAGQLEQEISDNAWLTCPADHDIMFSLPVERRWEAAASLIGIDVKTMSTDIGHA